MMYAGLETVALLLAAKRFKRKHRFRCDKAWPLQDCEMTRQQRRAAQRSKNNRPTANK